MNHTICITVETPVPNENEVKTLIEQSILQVLKQERVSFDAFVDVTLVSGETIRELNFAHRHKDAVTDVLSFPMYLFHNGDAQELLDIDPDIHQVMLGDMVMNYDRVLEQAQEYGHSPARECGYLAIHSALHLLGYDHEGTEDDRKLMRAREDAALDALHLTRGGV